VYTSLKIDNLDHLEVSYVSPSVYGKCVSPAAGAISSHEGQVSVYCSHRCSTMQLRNAIYMLEYSVVCIADSLQIYLEVTYPVGTSIIKRDVEKVLVNLLSVEGALCAWQKIPSTQEGVFRLLAEFYDASCAPRAVQRLNQMKIDVRNFQSANQSFLLIFNFFVTGHRSNINLSKATHSGCTGPTKVQSQSCKDTNPTINRSCKSS
jgi:hypothetical protein